MKALFGALMIFSLLTGCALWEVNNNYLRPEDFARRLAKDGIYVDAIRPLNPMPINAGAAVELKIAQANIGVYKFDTSVKAQKNRLEWIKKNKKVFFNGIPYPIYEASGSFIIIGLDKHKDKARILESFRKFR